MLLFCAKTFADEALAAFLVDRVPQLDEPRVQRARRRLVVVLPERELDVSVL
jgi:hypothetical protein